MKTFILALLLCLTACSNQPLEGAHYYLLRSQVPVSTGHGAVEAAFLLSSVQVASYLDQPGLVLEMGDGEVHMARLHQWAEPLRLSLRGFLSSEIGAALGQAVSVENASEDATSIAVRIDQLHGTADGGVILVAFWRTTTAAGEIASGQFSKTEALARDGYAALVAAELSLLRKFSRRIGRSLQ